MSVDVQRIKKYSFTLILDEGMGRDEGDICLCFKNKHLRNSALRWGFLRNLDPTSMTAVDLGVV